MSCTIIISSVCSFSVIVATFQPKPKRETMSVTSVRYSVDYCLVAVLFYSEPLMSFGCRQVAPENWRVDFVVGVSGE